MFKLINGKFYRTTELTQEEVLELLNKIPSVPKKLKLEPFNKKLDSSNWKSQTNSEWVDWKEKIVTELVNPEGDIWELDGEQYFTFQAMEREAKKYSWHVPTDSEWDEIIGDTPIMEFLKENNFKPSGYRDTYSTYCNRTNYTYLWSSTQVVASSAWQWYLNYSVPSVYRSSYAKANGFSVRCVEE